MSTRTITIDDRAFDVSGSDDDPYFANIEAFAADNHELNRVIGLLPHDAVCFDIGANIGITALILASRLPDGHVYAFEPSPPTYEFMAVNTRLLSNVFTFPYAVGAKPG